MSEWKEYKIEDFCEVVGGGTPSTKEDSFYGGNISWITPRDLTNYKNRFISTGERNITELGLRNSSARLLPKNTILLTSRAPIGYLAIASNEVCTNQGFKSLIVNPEIADFNYVYYLIKSNIERIKSLGTGTTFAEISGAVVKNLKFKIPDLPTQTAVAEILSSLDDKIELNNKINRELETLAQTLFKQWFIDFEFPNENGEPYKSSGGEMVDSELGEIPKGWEVNRLNEIADCFDNKRIPLSSMERNVRKGDYPYYGAASLMDYIDDYLFDGVYILMGEDGSVTDNLGYPVLQYVFGKFWVNNHAHVLKGRKISTELVLCLLKNTNISDLVTGAVQPKLNQGNMNKISIPLPQDLFIISNLEKLITEYYNLIRNNTLEINQLVTLRDILLPKLISGDLEINEISN
jgi:type I restriction enzyme S subunit